MAESYLARLPIGTQELEQAQKFLNQVSDYSYTLANKTIGGEDLSQEDLDNLTSLHQYCGSLNAEKILLIGLKPKWQNLIYDL